MASSYSLDELTYFREAALKICSSLDIKVVLSSCLEFLVDIMPVYGISVHQYIESRNAFQVLAIAGPEGAENVDLTFNLPAQLENFAKWPEESNIKIISDFVNDPVAHRLIEISYPYFKERDLSVIAMRLDLEQYHRIADLCIYARGKGQYKQEHSRLFSMLNEPFAISVANFLSHRQLEITKEKLAENNQYLKEEVLDLTGGEIIGGSSGLRIVIDTVEQIAPLDTPVFLTGETGVGKEVVANVIQQHSKRSEGPFIKVNCGAIPESILDSELFGHEKGAFTGAIDKRSGRFELANGGTIFLDEIGEMPLSAQVRLLRVLQDGIFERVGGVAPVVTDVRIIAATHRDIEQMVKDGQFREDLYFRLNVFPVNIPPLRDRPQDIPLLTEYFVKKKCQKMNRPIIEEIDSDSMKNLMNYHWPGNVRELENAVERSLIIHKSGPLNIADLSTSKKATPRSVVPDTSEIHSLDEITTQHIQKAMKATDGRIQGPNGAAELLKINPNTLRKRMTKLRIPFGRQAKYD